MELRRYLHLVRQRLVLVIVTAILGAAIAYLVTPRAPLYRTTAQLYVGSVELAQNPQQLYLETQLNQVAATFAEMIPSRVIAEKAIGRTGIGRDASTVLGETKATVVAGTSLIDVTVTDADPVVAQRLANAISTSFVDQVKAYAPGSTAGPGTVPTEPAYVFQDAPLPVAPLSNGSKRSIVLGLIFGLVIAVLLVSLLDYLDVTIKSPDELERRLDLPVLGSVPLATLKDTVGVRLG